MQRNKLASSIMAITLISPDWKVTKFKSLEEAKQKTGLTAADIGNLRLGEDWSRHTWKSTHPKFRKKFKTLYERSIVDLHTRILYVPKTHKGFVKRLSALLKKEVHENQAKGILFSGMMKKHAYDLLYPNATFSEVIYV